MLRALAAVLVALCSLACGGCKNDDEALSTDPLELIPADLHGVYGRTPQDAPGMTVGATGLEFGELKLVIHQGKMEGDTVRVERSTLQWKKLEPKTCTGTIARHGARLLLDLYEVDGAKEKCDSVLEAEWSRWEPLTELPVLVQGRYAIGLEAFSVASDQLRLDVGWFKADMKLSGIRQLPGTNDERAMLLIDDAKLSLEIDGDKLETTCTGTIELADGWLALEFWVPRRFELEPGSPEADDPVARAKLEQQRDTCKSASGRGWKFEVSMDGLPKAPIKKGEVSLAITPEKVVLDSPALRCEQELWGTTTTTATYGVFGGQRMTLGKAEPSAVSDACRLNLRIWCERQRSETLDAPTPEQQAAPPSERVAECMQEQERGLCPATITVQAISDLRYKFAIEPYTFDEIACVDTTGDFAVQQVRGPDQK